VGKNSMSWINQRTSRLKIRTQYIFKRFFSSPFSSSKEVDQCFVEDIMAIQRTGDKEQAFLDYVFETYIDPSGLFLPYVWDEFKATTNRTTIVCE